MLFDVLPDVVLQKIKVSLIFNFHVQFLDLYICSIYLLCMLLHLFRYSRSPSPYRRYGRSMSRSLSRSRSRYLFFYQAASLFTTSVFPGLMTYLSLCALINRSRESVDVENPGNNLYVTGLSTRVTKRELEKHFSSEGTVCQTMLSLLQSNIGSFVIPICHYAC